MSRVVSCVGVCVLAGVVLAPVSVAAQESKSAPLAAQLVSGLNERKLDSIAAGHQQPGRFVAALFFPGTQLLVISAKYSAPDRLRYLLDKRAYRDIYLDLSSASEQESRIFVSDLGANGLRFTREEDQPFDSVDLPGRSVSFNGQWGRSAGISEAEYREAFERADAEYAEMLQSLLDELQKSS
jgi:hypothetical protein